MELKKRWTHVISRKEERKRKGNSQGGEKGRGVEGTFILYPTQKKKKREVDISRVNPEVLDGKEGTKKIGRRGGEVREKRQRQKRKKRVSTQLVCLQESLSPVHG